MSHIAIHALDDRDSLLWGSDYADGTSQDWAYGPYGSISTGKTSDPQPGFNGERLDPLGLGYHLGNGYRSYSPTLMRFTAPDSWSPFGAGGLNMYAYCEGDPINRSDPSGHLSWQGAVGFGLGALGLLGAVFSFGTSLVAAFAMEAGLSAASVAVDLVASGLGVVAGATGVASEVTQQSDPEASRILGWVSLGLGLASFGIEAGARITQKLGGPTRVLTNEHEMHLLGGEQGTQRNLTYYPQGFCTFEDEGSIGARLTIDAHGLPGRIAAMLTTDQLDAILGAEHLYDHYAELRLLSCHSADAPRNGRRSLAKKLADHTGLPVEGFHGGVSVPCVMEPEMKTVYRNFLDHHILPEVTDEFRSRIARGPYVRIVTWWPHNYRPETFEPSWYRHSDRRPGIPD